MTRNALLLLAGISVLALPACGEQQQAQAPTPPETVQPNDEPDELDESVDQLREGGEGLLREGERLAGEARERAERALEDAGPMLDRAGEIAGEIGQAVDAIVQRAADDLAAAARYLEDRIEQSTEDRDIQPPDPDAVLAPDDDLRADTRAAAHALSAGVGPDYVGVWATEAAACSRIDQTGLESFAVITPTTMRGSESVCNIESQPLEDGEAEITASCVAEGMEEDRDILFSMPDIDTLHIRYNGAATGAELVRCYPQE